MAEVDWKDDESVVRAAFKAAGVDLATNTEYLGYSWQSTRATHPTVIAFEVANRPLPCGHAPSALVGYREGDPGCTVYCGECERPSAEPCKHCPHPTHEGPCQAAEDCYCVQYPSLRTTPSAEQQVRADVNARIAANLAKRGLHGKHCDAFIAGRYCDQPATVCQGGRYRCDEHDPYLSRQPSPPVSEAETVEDEPVHCANCGEQLYHDGGWRHTDTDSHDCVLAAVPKLPAPVPASPATYSDALNRMTAERDEARCDIEEARRLLVDMYHPMGHFMIGHDWRRQREAWLAANPAPEVKEGA